MPKDNEYERQNRVYSKDYPHVSGGGIKCKNYEICEGVLPLWWYGCKGNYLCTNCDMKFGTWCNPVYNIFKTGKGILPVVLNRECPICLEVKEKSVEMPNCSHTLCLECFKRCHYGDFSGKPVFPYSNAIKTKYYEDDNDDNGWMVDFPLIHTWEKETEEWYHRCNMKFNSEEYLRLCCVCRK